MIDMEKILIVIPARGGSKRLPRKNVLPLAGKPMISWTIESAIGANLDSSIIVTSDDEEILNIVKVYCNAGVIAYKRPCELATDTASTLDVVVDACNYSVSNGFIPNVVVVLQPTSPLRESIDIKNAMEIYRRSNRKNTVVSMCEIDHPTAWIGYISEVGEVQNIDFTGKRSQDYQKEYRLNGAIYIFGYEVLNSEKTIFTEKCLAYVMPKNRSIDVDDKFDFEVAGLFKKLSKGNL